MSGRKPFFNKTLILTSIVCLLPMVLGFALWNKLPENIPQQYGWNNQVNWTLPKFWGIITLPLVMVIINIVYSLLFRFSKQELSPKSRRDFSMAYSSYCPSYKLFYVLTSNWLCRWTIYVYWWNYVSCAYHYRKLFTKNKSK